MNALEALSQLTDQSNWGDMSGDYLKGYSDAMEQVHELYMEFWDELRDKDLPE